MNSRPPMHAFDRGAKRLSKRILRYALKRVRMDPPLDHAVPAEELRRRVGHTVTLEGIGAARAMSVWENVLAPACISIDHPRYFSYVPAAPTEAAGLFDVAASAANIFGGSWQEGAGAIFAENEALRWIADLAGMAPDAGGVFVSGGTAGNLSALVAARWKWRHESSASMSSTRGVIIASRAAHSSINQAAQVMDVDVVWAQDDDRGRLSGEAVRAAWQSLSAEQQRRTFCVVATGGTTNVGIVDDLEGVGQFSAAHGLWFHVDAAYGGAALAAPSVRELFNGIERADSLIVDPHKWLFAPFDSCALLYRDPRVARAAHTQHAEYLDALRHDDDWNPSDYAHHLTRRARGLPLWFSLAVHGTVAYSESVERSLTVTREGADDIRMSSHLELVLEPELSVLVFRRRGWTTEQYYAWSDKVLTDGLAFVVPTSWRGETVLRMCLVNPATTRDDLRLVFDSLK